MILLNAASGRTMTVGDLERKKIDILLAAGWREVKEPEMLQAKPVTTKVPATSFTLNDLQVTEVVEEPLKPVLSAPPVPNVWDNEESKAEQEPEVVEDVATEVEVEQEPEVYTAVDLPEPATQSKQAKGRNKKNTKSVDAHEWIGNLAEK